MSNRHVARLIAVAVALAPAAMAVANPAAHPAVQKATVHVKLAVNGMACKDCGPKVKKAAMAVAGVADCVVDQHHNQATVTFDPSKANLDQVIASLKKAGFKAKKTA